MQEPMNTNQEPIVKRIIEEKTRLEKIFTRIPLKTRKVIRSLIANAAFMTITLEELCKTINLNGTTESYTNGANQCGVKKSSHVEVYNTMLKNHYTVMKQLADLLPALPPEVIDDGFDAFIKSKRNSNNGKAGKRLP